MIAKFKNHNGISMMELMIVVVVIGIIAAMAAPHMDGAIKQMKFNNVGREILSSYRLARSSAITLQEPHGVYFNSDDNEILVFRDLVNPGMDQYEQGDSVVSRDSIEVNFDYLYTSFPGQTVMFNPDGSASSTGDVFCYREEDGDFNSFSVYLTAATGRAKLEIYHY
jgi:prepilin-type N-terminal cleavage/methylation domain-containing protein